MDKKLLQGNTRIKLPVIAPVVTVLLLAFVPKLMTGYLLHVATLILMYATMALAWNWLGGFAGQLSLAHAVFFGLGAYTNGMLQKFFDINPWVGTLIAMVGVGLLSILIGLPIFRLSGAYFSIATITIAEMCKIIFVNWEATGKAVGLYLPIRESSLLHFQFSEKEPYYYIILVMFVIAIAISYWLKNSRNGYYFRAIREDADAAKTLGINILRTKLLAMVLSSMVCAMVGSFYVNMQLYIDPDNVFRFMTSVQIALIAVLGGMGSVWGPFIGSIIILTLSESSRAFFGGMGAGLDFVIYGLLIIIFAVWQPGGILGAIEAMRKKKKRLSNLQERDADGASVKKEAR